jgi:hypothetical protein
MAKQKKEKTPKAPKEPKVKQTEDSEMNLDEIPTDDEDSGSDLGNQDSGSNQTSIIGDEVDEAEENTDSDVADDEIPSDKGFELEAQLEETEVHAHVHPKVVGNICEFCGVDYRGKWVFDPAIGLRPANEKDRPERITTCKHYNHLNLKCSYCKNPEINKERALHIYSLPEKPNVLIVCCEDYRCVVAHRKRFGLKG